MTEIKYICIIVIAISMLFPGCIDQKPSVTPSPTVSPQVTQTEVVPTIVPTISPATPQPTITPVRTQFLYSSEVDELYGFYRVISSNGSASYTNRTLTINVSDSVRWVSVTANNYILTVVSKENLWNNSSSRLKGRLDRFNYTFTQPGTYEVYIKEFPNIQHQKIIVNP